MQQAPALSPAPWNIPHSQPHTGHRVLLAGVPCLFPGINVGHIVTEYLIRVASANSIPPRAKDDSSWPYGIKQAVGSLNPAQKHKVEFVLHDDQSFLQPFAAPKPWLSFLSWFLKLVFECYSADSWSFWCSVLPWKGCVISFSAKVAKPALYGKRQAVQAFMTKWDWKRYFFEDSKLTRQLNSKELCVRPWNAEAKLGTSKHRVRKTFLGS